MLVNRSFAGHHGRMSLLQSFMFSIPAMLWSVVLLLSAVLLGCSSSNTTDDISTATASGTDASPVGLIDDFEQGLSNWRNASEGSMEAFLEIDESAYYGSFSMKVRFSQQSDAEGWTNVHLPLADGWNEKATGFSLWLKAAKKTAILVKVHEGVAHNEVEHFGAPVIVGTDWKPYSFVAADFTVNIFSSAHDGAPPSVNGKLDIARASAIGFVEKDLPSEFFVDQIKFDF